MAVETSTSADEAEAAAYRLSMALRFAAQGIGVFPLRPGVKVPVFKGGHLDATTDPAIIRPWFANNPARNWGARGGAERTREDGTVERLAIVDIDTKNGGDGRAALRAKAEEAGLDLADFATFEVRTPSGGGHLYYFTDAHLRQGAHVFGPGSAVDVRTDKGYVVGPGSRVGAGVYEIVHDVPIASMGALANIFPTGTAAPEKDRNRDGGAMPEAVDPERAWARGVDIAECAAPAIEGEGGDAVTVQLAMRMRDVGCTEAQTLEILLGHWNEGCEPPWSPEDLEAKIRNAHRYAQEAPGSTAPEAVFSPILGEEIEEGAGSGPAPLAKKGAGLEVHRWHALRAQPVPPLRWIWGNYMPHIPFGLLTAQSGHGKSWLALQIAVGLATGLPVLGQDTCGPAGAALVAMEDDAAVLHRRLDALRASYGSAWTHAHDDLLDANFRLMTRARGASDEAHTLRGLVPEITKAMATTAHPVEVIFLDTLASISPEDENDNAAVRKLTAAIHALGDATGASIWALHHVRKSGTGRNAPALVDRMDPELTRGASALVAAGRGMIQLGWITSDEADRVGLRAEGANRRYAVLGVSKINDGQNSPWQLLEHSSGHGGAWAILPNGDSILATLLSRKAAATLRRSEELLLALHSGAALDEKELRAALLTQFYPDDPKGSERLSSALKDLRGNRHGWVMPRGLALTALGIAKIEALKPGHPDSACPGSDAEIHTGSIFD